MLVVQVQVHVKPGSAEDFIRATRVNASESLKETGIARFDVLRLESDPNRFVLVEAYRDAEAPARHKETAHYIAWRDAVAPMMAEPRTSVRFSGIHVPG